MHEIQAAAIEQAVYDLILEASYNIGPDVCEAVRRYRDAEPSPTGRAAAGERVPLEHGNGR